MIKFRQTSVDGMSKTTLRRWLILFFLGLAIPTAMLIQQAYSQLKWEAVHQYRLLAEELTTRINNQVSQLIAEEERRPFTDYVFLNIAGDSATSFLQRSPLSNYPLDTAIPGVVGYFQVDAGGVMLTPLVPQSSIGNSRYGISTEEWSQRLVLQDRIYQILSENSLVQEQVSPVVKPKNVARMDNKEQQVSELAESEQISPLRSSKSFEKSLYLEKNVVPELQVSGQAVFDQLNQTVADKAKKSVSKLGHVDDLELGDRYKIEEDKQKRQEYKASVAESKARKERNNLPEISAELTTLTDSDEVEAIPIQPMAPMPAQLKIHTFESEVDPFIFSQLDSGHFVLFRKVWREEQRLIQGILIEQQVFIRGVVNKAFQQTSLSQMSNLLAVYQGNVLSAFTGKTSRGYLSTPRELKGELLYQSKLNEPLGELELLFIINRLPTGAGAQVIGLIAIVLIMILCGGFLWMYRLGIKQIELVRQQQDFVSAVSHELKTPLTSIRMYGEMLREGWATEDKKQSYYDYIFDESERLSRLINNVLQLARMTRNEQQADFRQLSVKQLMDEIRSRISTQAERAGFKLSMGCDIDATVKVDPDWFTQIVINLIDNAIKFSANTDKKEVDLICKQLHDGRVQFSVRDYGPGIDKQQMKKIFKLFFRSENELTRETVGTGIGLALVHQMTVAMSGQVDVINCAPGAEFSIIFPQTG